MQTVQEHIEQHEQKTLEFLQTLVRIATVNPPGERYEECVGLLDVHLQGLGMKTQVVQVPDEVVAKTTAKYLDAYERLTGKKL
jgi:acetylornithine deacetylase/succinyl-diaminopimelate desuccinylase-like protein